MCTHQNPQINFRSYLLLPAPAHHTEFLTSAGGHGRGGATEEEVGVAERHRIWLENFTATKAAAVAAAAAAFAARWRQRRPMRRRRRRRRLARQRTWMRWLPVSTSTRIQHRLQLNLCTT